MKKRRRTAYQRQRRGEWHPALEWLRMPGFILLFLAGLPVMLPVALVQHARTERRRREKAERTPCVRCEAALGEAALERADAAWSEHLEQLHRENPGMRFRLVRHVWAVCTVCGQAYDFDEKAAVFVRQTKSDHSGESPACCFPHRAIRKTRRVAYPGKYEGNPGGSDLPSSMTKTRLLLFAATGFLTISLGACADKTASKKPARKIYYARDVQTGSNLRRAYTDPNEEANDSGPITSSGAAGGEHPFANGQAVNASGSSGGPC